MNENDEFDKLMNRLFGDSAPDAAKMSEDINPKDVLGDASNFMDEIMMRITAARVYVDVATIASETDKTDDQKVKDILEVLIQFGQQQYDAGRRSK